MNPITGIRYKCPTCANYDLCQKCEETIEHEHALLKCRKPENLSNEENDEIKKLFKHLFKGYGKHHHRRHSSSSSSKEK
ncbi:MAG: hypothetical protein KDD45_17825 [Bdellovibrionales bacterium]|nr:hypothetical protein [Bdellovibrionales bacterium]